ncbi:ComEC family DNA internalization-related competence protein, partial [Candidatus Poribacteria bacterium]|nr:ComEC family DNA internalization-related competence protein [Candidatus Poribacteria bacterium]
LIGLNGFYKQLLFKIAQLFFVSLSAQIGAGLTIAYTFRTASSTALLVNSPVVGLISLIIPLGFISIILGLLYLPLAAYLGYINHYILISPMILIISFFSRFKWSQIPVYGFSLWSIVAWSAVFVSAVNIPYLLRQKKQLIISGMTVIAIIVWSIALTYEGHLLKVTYLDVGQGDSIFIDSPYGGKILIDGGPCKGKSDTGKWVLAPFLQWEGIRKIDLIISTHPHNDHAGGLTYIVENFPLAKSGRIITSGFGLNTPTYNILKDKLNKKGIRYKDAEPGIIYWDYKMRIENLMYNAGDPFESYDARMDNNSIVLKLTYKNFSFLFPGDIRKSSEQKLINSGKDIRAHVLKSPHHGSNSSSSWEFLRAVQPKVGVISVGRENYFGHPSPQVLGRYRWQEIKTYRTDLNGAVTIITDGKRGWIETVQE